ncbi:hypothetical protein OSB04_016731 [Centaurea solstitialis]|uniref:Uncharacterized protein n=1 Tax=Centaurea solstitialis TaxID=347529 RepID=A0AA38TCK7_9ASTR|nr:hypothetical protein OSB04_016731 [Centaurea solstitialis]
MQKSVRSHCCVSISRYESLFIEEIIKSVRAILERTSSCRVGIGSRVKAIDQWLKDPTDVRVGVISGMRGVGKSTVAKVAYDSNSGDFDACIMLDIRKPIKQEVVLLDLKNQVLSNISIKEKQKVDGNQGCILKIQDAVCRKRILLLLDDVDQIEQVEFLLNAGKSFQKGSKIMITTSHEHLLSQLTHKPFKIQQLDDQESLRLFCWHAFYKFHPTKDYLELSERVVRRCEGLPLSLQLFGSSLFGKNLEVWESALEQLEASPDERNRKTLEVGYKLLNDNDRRLFLTIARSFVGKEKGEAVKRLEEHDFYSNVGMQNLLDRSFIRFGEDDKLIMQRLVLDMAREIIRQQTVDELAKHKPTRAIIETGTSERKRKRAKDCEDETMPQNITSSSFKRFCLGFFSLFKPTTH